MHTENHIVISLGGSLIVPEHIDTAFLASFAQLIRDYVDHGFKFIIIAGGGKTAREYITSIKEITHPQAEDLDWIGIATTRLNAELLRVSLGDVVDPHIIMNPENFTVSEKPVMVGAGWKPGNSSDLAAVCVARSVGAKHVINLSNIDFVYNKDPNVFSDATPIEEISWTAMQELLPGEWQPGLSAPFDPIAAREAARMNLEVAILNGENIDNLKNYLNGVKFIGTVIK